MHIMWSILAGTFRIKLKEFLVLDLWSIQVERVPNVSLDHAMWLIVDVSGHQYN